MEKRMECAINELINAELWSAGLYLSLQHYFEKRQLPIWGSWLNTQAQDNMNKVYQLMERICRDGGVVDIREMKRDTQQWQTPLAALNALLAHEHYMSRLIGDACILCRNVDASTYVFINDLYAKRIYVSTALMELLRILALEYERRLPCFL